MNGDERIGQGYYMDLWKKFNPHSAAMGGLSLYTAYYTLSQKKHNFLEVAFLLEKSVYQ